MSRCPSVSPAQLTRQFWFGYSHYADSKAKLVTYNGRGFDLPLMEYAAFRFGICARDHYLARDRYRGPIDLMDWFSNFGGCRVDGGINLLAKLLGLPGKMGVKGDQVYSGCSARPDCARSTTTASATRSTPTSSSSALAC